MPLHLSSLLFGVLLVAAAACGKKDAEATKPVLAGRWKYTREIEMSVAQDGIRHLVRDTLLPAGQYLELTPTAWILYNPNLSPAVITYTYTRQGDVLSVQTPLSAGYYTTSQVKIVELTASSLHLQSTFLRSHYDRYYTR